MPDPEPVKRALTRLATRPCGHSSGSRSLALSSAASADHRTVIDAASAAMEELAAAAAFVDEVGLDRLETAIETAENADDHAAARRGQRAKTELVRLQTTVTAEADHFHPGRGTTLGGGDEGTGK